MLGLELAPVIEGQMVECVGKYKYLGTIIDSKVTVEANCEAVYKKGNRRSYCLLNLLHPLVCRPGSATFPFTFTKLQGGLVG